MLPSTSKRRKLLELGLIPGVTRDHRGAGSLGLGESDARWVQHQGVRLAVRLDDATPVLDVARSVELHQVPLVVLMCAEALDSGLRPGKTRLRENALVRRRAAAR